MKWLLIVAAALFISGCKKEKEQTLTGSWVLTESINVAGITVVPPNHQATIHFKSNGDLIIAKNRTDNNLLSYLLPYSKYEVIDENIVLFYNPGDVYKRRAHFSITNGLLLQYEARCYEAEKFNRN